MDGRQFHSSFAFEFIQKSYIYLHTILWLLYFAFAPQINYTRSPLTTQKAELNGQMSLNHTRQVTYGSTLIHVTYSPSVVPPRSPFCPLWSLCVLNVISFTCPHLKATPQCVSTSSCNTNLASSDLNVAQEKYIICHTVRLYRRPSSQTHASGWHANYYFRGVCVSLRMHRVEREGWVICARQEEGEGGERWRKKGRRGISLSSIWNWDYPRWSPLALSLWHSWEASELRHGSSIEMKKRLLHQGDNCQSAGGVQWELLTSHSLCPADPHTPAPTSMPTRFPQPPSSPAKGLT